MDKLVILKLDGDLRTGLRVTLEIGLEGQRPDVEIRGELPPQTSLERHLSLWRETYRSLEVPTRLIPKQTIYYKPARDLIKQCSLTAYQLGEILKDWLESKDFRIINKRLREELSLNENIRLLVRAENNQLTRIPWHLWDFFDSYQNAEIAFSTSTYKRVSCINPSTTKKSVKILAVLGDSTGIDVEADRLILNSLPNAEVTFLVEPRRKDLNDKLWSRPWDILFFAGHSETTFNQGKIYINPNETLEIENLKKGIQEALKQGLQLVILNSCDGMGLAHDLEQLCIPQMIVMREPIPDRVAQEFLKNFLQSFSSGKPLYNSMREARERLEGLESEYPCATWLPVIFQNPAEMPPTWKSFLGRYPEAVSLEQKSQYDIRQEVSPDDDIQVAELRRAPSFNLHEIKDLAEVFRSDKIDDSDKKRELYDIGEVVQTIYPGYLGQVRYKASSWSACLYPMDHPGCWRTIPTGKKAKVIGVIASNKLVVVPSNFVFSQSEQKSLFSDIKAFFRRKWDKHLS